MCISLKSEDGSASLGLSQECSCPHVPCKADTHLKTLSFLSLVYNAVSFVFLHGNSVE